MSEQGTPTSDAAWLMDQLAAITVEDNRPMTERVNERLRSSHDKYWRRADCIHDDRVQRLLLALEHESTNPEYLSMYVDWLTEQLRLPSGLDEPITDKWLADCCLKRRKFADGTFCYTFDMGREEIDFYKDEGIWVCGFSSIQLLDQGEITTRRHVVNLCEALLMKPWAEIVAHNKQSN